jgi:methylenetetrahydrofolate dehydrogenase (NADP+)/methenyltetrahydrofolate cyclohydrolase
MGTVVDGKAISSMIQKQLMEEIKEQSLNPKLAVIVVGHDPASQIYVKRKRKACEQIGIGSELHEFPATATQEEVEGFVRALARCSHCNLDGILVQLPLPAHLDKNSILNAVPPELDVDCFNAQSVGLLAQGNAILKPCTPSGILEILNFYAVPTKGKQVTIINRSPVVGQPLSLMLAQEPYNATITLCHEYTQDIPLKLLGADIVITAVGKYPKFQLHPEWVNPGAVVIDVAMNREGDKLFGDVVEYEKMKEKASLITPVPGGVGPLTVAMLMRNTVTAARRRLIQTRRK